MKKKISIVLGIVIIVIIAVGIITAIADSVRVTAGHEPKCCIKTVSDNGNKVTYWGLGYKVIRHIKAYSDEDYEDNIGAKMGSWFMKYDLPIEKNIIIEHNGKTIKISDRDERDKIYNIAVNSEYEQGVCLCLYSHKIIIDNRVYFLKAHNPSIERCGNHTVITKEDIDTILKIIDNNQ